MLSVYSGPAGCGRTYLANLFAKNYIDAGQQILYVYDTDGRKSVGPYVDTNPSPRLIPVGLNQAFELIESQPDVYRWMTKIFDVTTLSESGQSSGMNFNSGVAQARVEFLQQYGRDSTVIVFIQSPRAYGDSPRPVGGPISLTYAAGEIFTLECQRGENPRIYATNTKNRYGPVGGITASYPVDLKLLGVEAAPYYPTLDGALCTKIGLILMDL